jgi:hypothetical protein
MQKPQTKTLLAVENPWIIAIFGQPAELRSAKL